MFPVFEHVRFKCSIMVNLFENLLSARAVIDSLSSIVSIDHFKTGLISNLIPKKISKKKLLKFFSKKNDQKMLFFKKWSKNLLPKFWAINLKPTIVSHSSTPNQTGLPDFGSQDVTNIGRKDGPLTYRTGNDSFFFGTVRTFYRTLSGFFGFIGHRTRFWQVVYCFSLLSSWYVILKQ